MLEAKILNEYRTVAIVGASPNPERPSYKVASYLMEHGYLVIPANPHAQFCTRMNLRLVINNGIDKHTN